MANSDNKKVSIRDFEKVMKETYEPFVTFDWNGVEVTVKKTLTLKEMLEFADTVVDSCFSGEKDDYLPEVADFLIKVCVLEKYANFVMPSNVNSKYKLIYQTDAFENVLDHINLCQYSEVCSAIEKKIAHRAQSNIEAVKTQINDLCNSFENLQNQLEGVFDGIGEDDMKALVNAVSDGNFDEDKLVKAYISSKNNPSGEE